MNQADTDHIENCGSFNEITSVFQPVEIPLVFEGHSVRVINRDGTPWFVLADICGVLLMGNPSMAASRLDEDEKGISIVDTLLGGPQQVVVINESGLYSLVLTSRKPAAKRFKKWVTAEVLPTIRRTGGYSQTSSVDAIREAVDAAFHERLPMLIETIIRGIMREPLITPAQPKRKSVARLPAREIEQIKLGPPAPAEGRQTYLTAEEVSERWDFKIVSKTLANWRCDRIGPPFRRFGNKILYPISTLEAWERNHQYVSTKDYGGVLE
ncbi:BRO family protein [Phenylobacterium ferrooxidans]|uniref:BRO family protein n=1 Tax=Phenylobacterium ferrooxidans TaxID=2982689 RepID=A0ABW6CJR1_9CAUL